MQYDQRVLRPRSTPKPIAQPDYVTFFLALVAPLFRLFFLLLSLFAFGRVRIHLYRIFRQRSHDDKLARVISKTLHSRTLKLNAFFLVSENIPDKAHYVITVWRKKKRKMHSNNCKQIIK